NALLRRLARRGVTFHATAAPEADDIRAMLGDVPVAVVPNGVDAAEFETMPTDAGRWLRNVASLKSDAGPLVGCLGRVHAKKGLEHLVRALPALAQRWPRTHALLAGPDDGSERVRLERLAAALGVGGRLHFLGGMY